MDLSEEAKAVRRIFRVYLAEQGITTTEFARRLGVSVAYVSAVMTGRKTPSKAMLEAAGYQRVVRVEYLPLKKCL